MFMVNSKNMRLCLYILQNQVSKAQFCECGIFCRSKTEDLFSFSGQMGYKWGLGSESHVD